MRKASSIVSQLKIEYKIRPMGARPELIKLIAMGNLK